MVEPVMPDVTFTVSGKALASLRAANTTYHDALHAGTGEPTAEYKRALAAARRTLAEAYRQLGSGMVDFELSMALSVHTYEHLLGRADADARMAHWLEIHAAAGATGGDAA